MYQFLMNMFRYCKPVSVNTNMKENSMMIPQA